MLMYLMSKANVSFVHTCLNLKTRAAFNRHRWGHVSLFQDIQFNCSAIGILKIYVKTVFTRMHFLVIRKQTTIYKIQYIK